MQFRDKLSMQDLPDANPLVLPHFKAFTYLKTDPNAQSIAKQNIQYKCIPPTFNKIW